MFSYSRIIRKTKISNLEADHKVEWCLAASEDNAMPAKKKKMLQAKIMQCQQTTLDLGAKLAAEKRDRDQDFDQVSLRLVI